MKKWLSIALLIVCSALFALGKEVPSATATVPGIDALKPNVVQLFLQKANAPTEQLHKKLEQFNQEHTDGRNNQGVLPKNLKANNIFVVTIGGEDQFGRYCNPIENNPSHSKCDNGLSETYLILIPYKMSVHKAVEYDSLQFVVKAAKKVEWKIDEREQEYDRHESIKIGEPEEASVQPVS